jgi:hypothetical protein
MPIDPAIPMIQRIMISIVAPEPEVPAEFKLPYPVNAIIAKITAKMIKDPGIFFPRGILSILCIE